MSRIGVFIEFQKMAFASLLRPHAVCEALMFGATQVLEKKLADPKFKGALRKRIQKLHIQTMGEHAATSKERLQQMFQAKLDGDEARFDELYQQHTSDDNA